MLTASSDRSSGLTSGSPPTSLKETSDFSTASGARSLVTVMGSESFGPTFSHDRLGRDYIILYRSLKDQTITGGFAVSPYLQEFPLAVMSVRFAAVKIVMLGELRTAVFPRGKNLIFDVQSNTADKEEGETFEAVFLNPLKKHVGLERVIDAIGLADKQESKTHILKFIESISSAVWTAFQKHRTLKPEPVLAEGPLDCEFSIISRPQSESTYIVSGMQVSDSGRHSQKTTTADRDSSIGNTTAMKPTSIRKSSASTRGFVAVAKQEILHVPQQCNNIQNQQEEPCHVLSIHWCGLDWIIVPKSVNIKGHTLVQNLAVSPRISSRKNKSGNLVYTVMTIQVTAISLNVTIANDSVPASFVASRVNLLSKTASTEDRTDFDEISFSGDNKEETKKFDEVMQVLGLLGNEDGRASWQSNGSLKSSLGICLRSFCAMQGLAEKFVTNLIRSQANHIGHTRTLTILAAYIGRLAYPPARNVSPGYYDGSLQERDSRSSSPEAAKRNVTYQAIDMNFTKEGLGRVRIEEGEWMICVGQRDLSELSIRLQRDQDVWWSETDIGTGTEDLVTSLDGWLSHVDNAFPWRENSLPDAETVKRGCLLLFADFSTVGDGKHEWTWKAADNDDGGEWAHVAWE
ncbi:hypothetical protein QFC21_007218 [Naganishia friedmannii]|uniref:Uncharacterized protein n=1 Tax=Naganishia friedmannii TaxID=89922 RepID=A0ACC2UX57_9TREE|nr:hypothetical protein QFC21_007218 [Naganishia friedmannii]